MWIYNEPADPPIHLVDATGPLTANMLEVGNYKGAQIHLFYRPAGYSGIYTLCRSDVINANWRNIRMPTGTVYDAIIDLRTGTVTSLRGRNGEWLLAPEVVGSVEWKYANESRWHSSSSIVSRTYFNEGENPIYLATSYGVGGYPVSTATVQIKYQSEEGPMDIVTGYIGEPHITAVQDRDTNRGIFGEESYILNVGSKLAPEVQSATEIRIRDGVLSHQGCVGTISNGTYDALTISNGSQGMLRSDLIVARYQKDIDTHAESLTLVVIEGTPAASSPEDPAYNQGDIRDGDSPVDFPLYRVNIDGVSIDSITRLAPLSSVATFSVSIENGTGGTGTCRGTYDPVRRTVRLTGWYRGVTTISTNTAIFIIPAGYRPSETKEGAGLVVTSSVTTAYIYDVTSSGGVRQRLSNQTVAGFFFIEYTI